MNILWHLNSPDAPTGCGKESKLFTPHLRAAGHEVAIGAFYGREGSPQRNADGILELPGASDLYGNDIIQAPVLHRGAVLAFACYRATIEPDSYPRQKPPGSFPSPQQSERSALDLDD